MKAKIGRQMDRKVELRVLERRAYQPLVGTIAQLGDHPRLDDVLRTRRVTNHSTEYGCGTTYLYSSYRFVLDTGHSYSNSSFLQERIELATRDRWIRYCSVL